MSDVIVTRNAATFEGTVTSIARDGSYVRVACHGLDILFRHWEITWCSPRLDFAEKGRPIRMTITLQSAKAHGLVE